MAYASGRLAYFGLTKQAAFNTPLAPTIFPRWLDGSMATPDTKFTEVNEGDGSADYSLVFKDKQLWKGKLVFYPRPQELGYIVQGISGSGSDAVTGAGDPYTHTFTPKDTPSYYTIEFGMNDTAITAGNSLIHRVQDCIFTQLTIEATANQPLKVTAEFVGRSATSQSARATVSLEADAPYKFVSGVFSIDSSDVSTTVTSFKFTYTRGVDEDIVTNAVTPADFIWTTRKMMIEYEAMFATNARFNLTYFGATNGTTDSSVNGTGAIDFTFYPGGLTADAHTFEFKLNSIVYQGKPIEPKLDGKAVRYQMVALAIRPGSGNIVDFILKNAKTTAY